MNINSIPAKYQSTILFALKRPFYQYMASPLKYDQFNVDSLIMNSLPVIIPIKWLYLLVVVSTKVTDNYEYPISIRIEFTMLNFL